MREKIRREYSRRTKLIMKSGFNGSNKIMAMDTWAVFLMRHVTGILK